LTTYHQGVYLVCWQILLTSITLHILKLMHIYLPNKTKLASINATVFGTEQILDTFSDTLSIYFFYPAQYLK